MSSPIPSLPDDLLVSCIARVSRLYYPTLSLVSKSFRSLLASPELYQTRSNLGQTENCLYVCLELSSDPYPRWFTLCRRPDRTKKKQSESGNLLVPVPSRTSPLVQPSKNLVAVGSNIYNIGGCVHSSSRVSVLDCKTHTWHEGLSMRVERFYDSTVCVLDGKIYVAGGCEDRRSMNWVESFDPKTETWSSVTSPDAAIPNEGVLVSIGLEGKLYLSRKDIWNKCGAYDVKQDRWNPVPFYFMIPTYMSHGVIDNILFIWYTGVFKWYDFKENKWKILKGVEGLPYLHPYGDCQIVDYGGKMAVLWDMCDDNKENMVWCAEIALERRSGDGIWGKVEWVDVVLRVHKSCKLSIGNALSVTV